MTGPDIQETVLADVERRLATPEGVTVWVASTDEPVARMVAPLVADRLYPGRVWGDVLHVERVTGGYDITVQDRGPRRFTNRSGIPAPEGTRR